MARSALSARLRSTVTARSARGARRARPAGRRRAAAAAAKRHQRPILPPQRRAVAIAIPAKSARHRSRQRDLSARRRRATGQVGTAEGSPRARRVPPMRGSRPPGRARRGSRGIGPSRTRCPRAELSSSAERRTHCGSPRDGGSHSGGQHRVDTPTEGATGTSLRRRGTTRRGRANRSRARHRCGRNRPGWPRPNGRRGTVTVDLDRLPGAASDAAQDAHGDGIA